MGDIVINESENDKKLVEFFDDCLIIWTEYKMKDKWFEDETMILTKEEFKKIIKAFNE